MRRCRAFSHIGIQDCSLMSMKWSKYRFLSRVNVYDVFWTARTLNLLFASYSFFFFLSYLSVGLLATPCSFPGILHIISINMQYSRAVRLTNNIPATFFLKKPIFWHYTLTTNQQLETYIIRIAIISNCILFSSFIRKIGKVDSQKGASAE